MRVTEKFLREYVDEINKTLDEKNKISIEWAYGQPRIYMKDGSVEISHRLPTGQMYEWLLGFMWGLETAHNMTYGEEGEVNAG